MNNICIVVVQKLGWQTELSDTSGLHEGHTGVDMEMLAVVQLSGFEVHAEPALSVSARCRDCQGGVSVSRRHD